MNVVIQFENLKAFAFAVAFRVLRTSHATMKCPPSILHEKIAVWLIARANRKVRRSRYSETETAKAGPRIESIASKQRELPQRKKMQPIRKRYKHGGEDDDGELRDHDS
jgi:hypothetical protein